MSTAPLSTIRRRRSGAAALTGGGTDGNEILTTVTGIVLLVMLAAVGVTIVRIGQLLWLHLFLGLLVIGPVGLKLASTGYRFTRYYTGDEAYVSKGPPWTPLRLLAPIVALSTIAVFVTGLVMLFGGAPTRQPWLLLHKVSFIVWVVFTALHVLGHLPETSRMLGVRSELAGLPGIRRDLEPGGLAVAARAGAHEARLTGGAGATGRWLALTGAVVVGLVVALVLIPEYHSWTSAQQFLHHH
jgi:hypothetical protein